MSTVKSVYFGMWQGGASHSLPHDTGGGIEPPLESDAINTQPFTAWSSLPEAIRRAIVALVRSQQGSEQ